MPNSDCRRILVQAMVNIYKSDVSMQERLISLCKEQGLSRVQKTTILSVISSNPSNESVMAILEMFSQDSKTQWLLKNV